MIELYDSSFRALGPLDTALKWGYKELHNDLTTAMIRMAGEDPAHEKIDAPAGWARLTDGTLQLGMFRFGAIPEDAHAPGAVTTYKLTHAACTLLDDMLIGWHELGGTGITTRQVLEYILARQTEKRWALGRCDFEDYYQYNFEDVTLLEAVMSLGEVLTEDYAFEFIADGSPPWTMNFVRLGVKPVCNLVYGRGMTELSRSVEEGVVTRLVGRGYGEGDNQLTIASVNGGCEYLDADTISRYGVRVGIHADRRQTDPLTLKARMEAILRMGKAPRVSYKADALDLYRATGERIDLYRAGDCVLVLDSKYGRLETRIVSREKADVEGDPGTVTVTLSTAAENIRDALNEVLEKIGVQELYSQGATNMYSQQHADNADAEHPLVMRFYVPGNAIRINSCLLTWKLERFRSYAEITEAEGESMHTSSAGGGATVTIPAQTISTGVKYASGPMDASDGSASELTGGPKNYQGSASTSTGSAGNHSHNFTHVHALAGHGHDFTGEAVTYSIAHNHLLAGEGALATGAIYSGNKSIRVTAQGTVDDSDTLWTTSAYDSAGGSGKQATGENGSHSHSFDHVHSMPHSHNIAHEHTIPALNFELSSHNHTVSLPAHTHGIEHGIYEGSRADAVTLRVDGVDVPAEAVGENDEVDICAYMRKNDDGRIVRSTWHEVEFVPSGLTRIVANLFFQVFIQSRGAGDY